ncbi:hypothetical protein BDV18DRAFT_131174 [Aspergillus unguis]
MEDSIRPTARWANRMLRPLTSIYHRLEKHHEIVTSVLISKTKERSEAAAATETEQRTRLAIEKKSAEHRCAYEDDEEPNDPAWIPGKIMDRSRRRIRHSYSSRGQRGQGLGQVQGQKMRRRSRLLIQSPEAPKTLPGAIEIATPLITGKIRGGPGFDALAEGSPSLRMQLFQNHMSDSSTVDNDNATACPGEARGKTRRTNNSSFRPYQGSWKEVLDQSGDPGLVDIAHLLDRILLKFLGATRVATEHGSGGQRGARSLLSMAVRRLPEFIADEQREQDELDECDVDMCDAYFTELEAAYAPGGNGWQPLREAVRAQGIYFVSCMIQNRWITSLAACRLLEECLSQQELDAFESLEAKVLSSVETYHYPVAFEPPKPSGPRDDPIRLLAKYYLRHPTRQSYVFRQLTMLLTRGTLPPEWMVTTVWKKCVDKAIKSVSMEDRDYAAARQLIMAVILSAAGVYSTPGSNMSSSQANQQQAVHAVRSRETRQAPGSLNDRSSCPIPIQDALSNLVSSLLTALCGMCIARSQAANADEKSAALKTREIISDLAFTVQRSIGDEMAAIEPVQSTLHPLRRGYVLLADCTLYCGRSVAPEIVYHAESVSRRNIESFFRASATRHDVVKELAKLASQVFQFHHAERLQDQGAIRIPREILSRVSQLAQLTSTPGVALLLGKVAAEAAMELAEKSADPDDHSWAVEIQETVASFQSESAQQSPSSNQLYTSLYRWEDSIGEWVARTPGVKARANSVAAARPQVRGRGRPRVVPCSTSSSSSSSSCSEESISSVTSSAPSVSRKRPSASQNSSPRPFKKTYLTRSVEEIERRDNDSVSEPDRSPSQPPSGSGAMHVPVAARTRTGLRDVPQRTSVDRRDTAPRAGNPSVGRASTFEVVIVNKSPNPSQAAATSSAHHLGSSPRNYNRNRPGRPKGRRARHSMIHPRKSPRLQRRQSAPVQITRQKTIIIPCSQDDDSDDELSFL